MSGIRRISLPPDGGWHVALRIGWSLYWQDGTPERCQRPVPIPDEDTVPAEEHDDESSIGG